MIVALTVLVLTLGSLLVAGMNLLTAIVGVAIGTLGITTLRKGHWVLFILGIFLPLLWIIGAVIPPTNAPRTA